MNYNNATKPQIDAAIAAQPKTAQWTRQVSTMGSGVKSRVYEVFKADGVEIFHIETEGNYKTVLMPALAGAKA